VIQIVEANFLVFSLHSDRIGYRVLFNGQTTRWQGVTVTEVKSILLICGFLFRSVGLTAMFKFSLIVSRLVCV
jgi:hypothetical protein